VGKKSKRPSHANRGRAGARGHEDPDVTPILDKLAELDETLTAKMGPEWVFSIEPDHDGPFMYVDGETYTLGPRARAMIVDLRRINDLIIEAGREAVAAEAGAL
jgi:hypothetical protein